ncbi:MAG TPA: hypothetical protein DCX78_03300, partial [Nitrospina sp.]|nr:hypothetical protein [Nitrospina sp.]
IIGEGYKGNKPKKIKTRAKERGVDVRFLMIDVRNSWDLNYGKCNSNVTPLSSLNFTSLDLV